MEKMENDKAAFRGFDHMTADEIAEASEKIVSTGRKRKVRSSPSSSGSCGGPQMPACQPACLWLNRTAL